MRHARVAGVCFDAGALVENTYHPLRYLEPDVMAASAKEERFTP